MTFAIDSTARSNVISGARSASSADAAVWGPSVAVVVPCRNEARWIRRLLDAIAAQHRLPEQVVIVDDGSLDDSLTVLRDWVAHHPELNPVIIKGGGRGAGAAMNLGISCTTADVIVRLDGHSEPGPDYVRLALETLARPGAGLVGGVWHVEPAAPTRCARVIASVLSQRVSTGGAAYRHGSSRACAVSSVDTVPFGCFRRSLWQELGGFDERLMANQDYDFNYRVRRAGFDVLINSGVRCVYRARPTLRELAQQYFRYGFWKRQMLRKSPRALHWRQIPPILLLPVLVALIAAAAVTRHPLAISLASAYPILLLACAIHVGRRLNDLAAVPLAVAAIATIHVAWSTGFWSALVTRPLRGAN